MIFQKSESTFYFVLSIRHICTNLFWSLAQHLNKSNEQNKKALLQSQKDSQCSKKLIWERDVPQALNLHQMLNISSFKVLYGWQYPSYATGCLWLLICAWTHTDIAFCRWRSTASLAISGGASLVDSKWTQLSAPCSAQANVATCRRESDEGEEGRLEERRLRESSHWSTKNRRDGSVSGYKIKIKTIIHREERRKHKITGPSACYIYKKILSDSCRKT